MKPAGVWMCCLICGDNNLLSEDQDLSVDIKNKFAQQLGLQGQGLSCASPAAMILCGDCKSGVVKATEWRDQVDEVERDARSLQRIILKMMRQLKSLRGDYLEEMRKMEGKIRGSNTNRITATAFRLRQGILAAVMELGEFQDCLADQPSPVSTEQNDSAAATSAAEFKNHNPCLQALEPDIVELSLPQNSNKSEANSCSFADESRTPERNNDLPNPDPVSPLDHNNIDIIEPEPLTLEKTQEDDQLPRVTSTYSCLKPRKKKGLKKLQAGFHQQEFSCQICEITCASKSKLKLHMYSSHTEGRPHNLSSSLSSSSPQQMDNKIDVECRNGLLRDSLSLEESFVDLTIPASEADKSLDEQPEDHAASAVVPLSEEDPHKRRRVAAILMSKLKPGKRGPGRPPGSKNKVTAPGAKFADAKLKLAAKFARKRPSTFRTSGFKCSKCNKFYGQMKHLTRHEKQVECTRTGWRCEICNLICRTPAGYTKHLRCHEKITAV